MFQKCLINGPSKREKYLQEYLSSMPDIQRKILNSFRKRKCIPHPTPGVSWGRLWYRWTKHNGHWSFQEFLQKLAFKNSSRSI